MMFPRLPAVGVHDTTWVAEKGGQEEEMWGRRTSSATGRRGGRCFFSSNLSSLPEWLAGVAVPKSAPTSLLQPCSCFRSHDAFVRENA